MNRQDKLLLGLGVAIAIISAIGCARSKPAPHAIHVPHVPYKAHFDPAHCHYLPDGIRFKCKDVIFDPTEIDSRQFPPKGKTQ